MSTFLTAVRPSFLIRDNLNGAFQRARSIERRILDTGISAVNRLLDVKVNVLPFRRRYGRPERLLKSFLDQFIRRDLYVAVVVVEPTVRAS